MEMRGFSGEQGRRDSTDFDGGRYWFPACAGRLASQGAPRRSARSGLRKMKDRPSVVFHFACCGVHYRTELSTASMLKFDSCPHFLLCSLEFDSCTRRKMLTAKVYSPRPATELLFSQRPVCRRAQMSRPRAHIEFLRPSLFQ